MPNGNHPVSSPVCPMGVADTLEQSLLSWWLYSNIFFKNYTILRILIWSSLIKFDLIWSDLIWFDLIWSDLIPKRWPIHLQGLCEKLFYKVQANSFPGQLVCLLLAGQTSGQIHILYVFQNSSLDQIWLWCSRNYMHKKKRGSTRLGLPKN